LTAPGCPVFDIVWNLSPQPEIAKAYRWCGGMTLTLPCLLLAEAVEKVGVIENQATFDQSSLVFGYNDSR
jgi:hypothetical protein